MIPPSQRSRTTLRNSVPGNNTQQLLIEYMIIKIVTDWRAFVSVTPNTCISTTTLILFIAKIIQTLYLYTSKDIIFFTMKESVTCW